MKFSQAIVLIAVFSATANAIVVPAEASVSTGGPDATSTDQSSTSASTPSATSTGESSATSTGESGASGYTSNSGEGSSLSGVTGYLGYAADTARCYGGAFWKRFQSALGSLIPDILKQDPDVRRQIKDLMSKLEVIQTRCLNGEKNKSRVERLLKDLEELSAELKEKVRNGEKGAKEALVKWDGIAKEFGQGVENLAQIVERDRLEASKNGEEEEQE
ncbi:hypothetical protein BDV3_002397 [Batrachochytrium dendrobatidis]|nr:hypothetical protein O5D80_000826 [Batrachochytrium dendrobatidis]